VLYHEGGEWIKREDLKYSTTMPEYQFREVLDSLLEKDLIQTGHDFYGEMEIGLTRRGRLLLINHGPRINELGKPSS
jgi:hypothetical protein